MLVQVHLNEKVQLNLCKNIAWSPGVIFIIVFMFNNFVSFSLLRWGVVISESVSVMPPVT